MKHILLVEDSLGDAQLAIEMLKDAQDFDVDVQCVGRLAHALDVLGTQPIDLVLLDLTLPDSRGLEGLKQLQGLSKDAPIIVLSGINDKALALDALKQGAQDYLLKGTMNAEAMARVVQYAIERKAAEIRYRSLVANIPGVVYRCRSDQGWSVVFASSPFESLSGYAQEELFDKLSGHYGELIHPEDRNRVTRQVHDAITQGEAYSVEYRLIRKDGLVRWVVDRGQGIGRVNGTLPVRDGVLFDVTGQRQMEERIRKADQQLAQARQFSALGNLANGVAHDFNNLITAINGFASLAIEELRSDSPSHARLMHIQKASAKATTITRQLLALGQKSMQEPTLVDLTLLITELRRLLRLVIGPTRPIDCLTEQFLGRVNANPGQLEQIVMILAMNLIEGRGEQVGIRIETTTWEISKDEAERLALLFGGTYVVLRLRITSQGTADDGRNLYNQVVFESEAVKDLGVGMETVVRVLEEMHGYLLTSHDEAGLSGCQVLLPLAEVDASRMAVASAEPPLNRNGERQVVLVVDDEESVLALIKEILERQGYRVLLASNGLQALEMCRHIHREIDLLMTDEIMPGLSGHELADQFVARHPQLRVLHMSTLKSGLDDEALPVLLKPFTAGVLLKRVEEALQTGSPRCQAS